MAGIADAISPVSAGISAAEGIYQFIDNIGKEKRDRAALAGLESPFYTIQNEYYQNRNLSRDLAQGGIPIASKDYQTSESQRGLSGAISGELQSGANPNDINRLYQSFNRNIDNTAAQDAAEHVKNIQYYMDQNANLAAQKTIQFGVNKVQPFQRRLAQLTGNLANDQVNANNGASQFIGSANALGTGLQNNSLLNNLFKTPTASTQAGTNAGYDTTQIPSYATPSMASSTDQVSTSNPSFNQLSTVNPFGGGGFSPDAINNYLNSINNP